MLQRSKLISRVLELLMSIVVLHYSNAAAIAQVLEELRFGGSSDLKQLLDYSNVEFYQTLPPKPFEDPSGVRQRYFLCMNSLSIITVTQTVKDAYPPSFSVILTTRTPESGIYQFQEIDKDRMAELGIDLELLTKLQKSKRHALNAQVDPVFKVSIPDEKIRDFELLMEQVPVKKPSALSIKMRISSSKKGK